MVIRGPLGSGKSTLSLRLSKRVGGVYISIDRILEENGLEEWHEGYISERSFLRANDFAVRLAQPSLRRGIPVVIDGNFYWQRVVEDLLGRLAYPHVVFTLELPLSFCIARDAGRVPSYGREATKAVFDKTTTFDVGELVDATGTVDATLGLLVQELTRRRMLGNLPTTL